jgi:transcriptional regulator with XRE-family HTH domain
METKTPIGFSERFEQIKAHFRLRNRDLSRMAGVSDTAINKIISGVTESPDVRTLVALGKKLNLSADWLLFGEGPMIKEEAVEDNSLKRGLQLRDELIAQLQKELWGKLEGVTDRPLSNEEIEFWLLMFDYKISVLKILFDINTQPKFYPIRGKVGGTRLAYAASAV